MNDAVHARGTSSWKRPAALLASRRFRTRNSVDETPSLFALLSTKSGRNRTIVLALPRGLATYAPPGSRDAFDVTVVTETPGGNYPDGDLPFRTVQNPGIFPPRESSAGPGRAKRCLAPK